MLTLALFMMLLAGVICERESRDLSHHKNHQGVYNPEPHLPAKCHPQTFTKYKTIYKDRKAEVVNQIEVRNPQPQVKKITEQRYTTIRYPVFITQVIKPLLTQVETKVKPVFFTETVNKYTTVLFTVTGIGQVTVTTLKYEKEYITRCMNKGGYHRSFLPEEGVKLLDEDYPRILEEYGGNQNIPPPPGLPYGEPFDEPQPFFLENSPRLPLRRRFSGVRERLDRPRKPWRKRINRRRRVERRTSRHPSNIEMFARKYTFGTPTITGRSLEASADSMSENSFIAHPPLQDIPVRVLA